MPLLMAFSTKRPLVTCRQRPQPVKHLGGARQGRRDGGPLEGIEVELGTVDPLERGQPEPGVVGP